MGLTLLNARSSYFLSYTKFYFLRFIFIKYSHRGLVVNGKLPILFYTQYILSSFVFYSLFLLLLFFKTDESQYFKNLLGSFNGDFNGLNRNIRHISRYFLTLMCIFFILILIISLGIFYLKRRYNHQNYCRQNVFTLNGTLFWGLIHLVLLISFWFTLRDAFKKNKIFKIYSSGHG